MKYYEMFVTFVINKGDDFIGTYKNYQGTREYWPITYQTREQISSEVFRKIEDTFLFVSKTYGFNEIIIPTIEMERLYKRTEENDSDMVQKEMFEVVNQKDPLVLRPEGTASVIRSYVQNKTYVSPNESVKLCYKGSMFRKERPQAGRQREFTQLGVEAIGSEEIYTDVEVIALAERFFQTLNLRNIRLEINSIGCKSCRSLFELPLG